MAAANLSARLEQANRLAQGGQMLQAELLYVCVLKDWPGNIAAMSALAKLALLRDDVPRAIQFLREALQMHPNDAQLSLEYAAALAKTGRLGDAAAVLETALDQTPAFYQGWLLLGQLRDAEGNGADALRAWYEAVTRAHWAGQWRDERTTPAHLHGLVLKAIERVREGKRELLFGSYDQLRRQFGAHELARVDRALTGYLGEWDSTPADPRQRPKFFHFPDLPSTPYHDPFIHPWAKGLQSAYQVIREDALRVLAEDQGLQNFIEPSQNGRLEDYLRGEGGASAWEAFFFYRHGERFDANHARCPQTSAVLESIELCRIADQTPEICFSVLKPGSHIMPHYGVSNVRLVMHLPLLVPLDCALNVIDAGEHHWREGQLMMFDDTYQHEAWNRSDTTRIVLLMDCWNPHLTQVERLAVRQLIEMINGFLLSESLPPRSS
jgi:aspartate beta-hydroxylase